MTSPYDYVTIIDDKDWKLVAIIPHINSPERNSHISIATDSPSISQDTPKKIPPNSISDLQDRSFSNLLPNIPRNNFLLGIGR